MIEYNDINQSNIGVIKELWENNRDYHVEIEDKFKKQYRCLSFEERMREIFDNRTRIYKITIAEYQNIVLGYSISAIKQTEGELISIHVKSTKRSNGIGKKLVEDHIKWMKNNGCSNIGVYVSSSNSQTIEFYKRFGFESNLVYMQIVE